MKVRACKETMVSVCCSKYATISLFLVVFVFILVLFNMDVLEFQHEVITTFPAPRPHLQHHFCSFQPRSPEDALEERLLLDSIAWPETPSLPVPLSLEQTTDPAHSTFTILPEKGGRQWHVGDQLEVMIKMYDFKGRPKKSGGDVLLAGLHNQVLGAGVVGQVLDHLDGSYSAVFSLLWEGRAHVEPLCNYTDLHTGDPWFCYKPKKLSCDTRIKHSKGGFNQKLKAKEEMLFKSGVNMKVSINASGSANVNVLPKMKGQPEVKSSSVKSGPSGYYYQDMWRALDGTTVRQFNTSSAISQCLKGKVVHLYGDSTIRQWFEHLNAALPDLKEFNLHNLKQVGPFMALDYANNILVTYRCHGPPIRFTNIPTKELRYIANELDDLVGGINTVVVLGIWAHFSTFPIELYIKRLQSIRRAVVRLLDRAPGTLVIIRTANLKALSLYEALTNSDWYSLQCDKVLRAMFKGLNVHLVDAWEMVLAHHLPHSLHPQPPIIKNMIDVLLSHICPKNGS
ncbi:NXPE family member 3-like isoform X2 [Thunnus thynnus]|uniref:NXPE family member 3-like isoform X2 n=1 Tax=Thunnus thynnus TaxID=8237 RepID=UPI003529C2E5